MYDIYMYYFNAAFFVGFSLLCDTDFQYTLSLLYYNTGRWICTAGQLPLKQKSRAAQDEGFCSLYFRISSSYVALASIAATGLGRQRFFYRGSLANGAKKSTETYDAVFQFLSPGKEQNIVNQCSLIFNSELGAHLL